MDSSRVSFADLVEIYRNTQFEASGREGILTVASPRIEAVLRTLEQDTRLLEETNIALLDEADAIGPGRKLRIHFGPPRLAFGALARNWDELWELPGTQFEEPAHYYILEDDASSVDPEPSPVFLRYRALLQVVALFARSATWVDRTERELVFVDQGKIVIPLQFRTSDLTDSLANTAALLTELFEDPLHAGQKLAILATTLIDMTGAVPESQRFPYLLHHLDTVVRGVTQGYNLFASSFSYAKIRGELENAHIDYMKRIHNTLADIQGQLLGIPVATIIVTSQLQPVEGCDLPFWTNLAVLFGGWIFVALLSFSVVNQWTTLSALARQIDRQRHKLATDYARVSAQFADIFRDLDRRIFWHRLALVVVAVIGLLGAILTTIAFAHLTAPQSVRCIIGALA
ncbi:MAG: hypothetical protein WCZ66_09010 [Sphingomonadaceae bacterium]